MTKTDAVAYFGSSSQLARALKCSCPSVCMWGDEVPPLRQFQLERITQGALKVDPKHIPEPVPPLPMAVS